MPISEIKIGNMFTNPFLVNDEIPDIVYIVEDLNIGEKLIKVRCYNGSTLKPIEAPFWKKSSDRMFSDSWRLEQELKEDEK